MEQMNLIISTVLIILGTFNIATLASPMKHHDYPEFSSERKANKDFSRLSIQREVHVPEELVSRGEQSGEALAPPAPTPTPAMIPNLSGTWYNQLGSNMTIVQRNDGLFTGYYINQAPGSQDYTIEQLIGSYGNGIPATFGFVVNYVEGKFTTAWSGQYHQESKDGEVLLTTWIMTANQQDPEEYWKAVNIGQDRFTRMPWVENYK